MRALQEGAVAQRWQAARALRYARTECTFVALLGALTDENPLVRWTVAESLARRRGSPTWPKLQEELRSENPLRQAMAAEALGLAVDVTAAEPLSTLLQHRDLLVRQATAEALGRLRDPASARGLAAVAGDALEAVAVRYAALGALGAIAARLTASEEEARGHIQAVLIAVLSDSNPLLRAAAWKALGSLQLREPVPGLAGALQDADVHVRWQAVRLLGRLGTREHVRPLKVLFADKQTVFGQRISWLARWAVMRIALREAKRESQARLRVVWDRLQRRRASHKKQAPSC